MNLKYNKIKDLVMDMQKDVEKFDKGNNAAGTRIRKSMQEVKVLAQKIRLEVQNIKNERTAK